MSKGKVFVIAVDEKLRSQPENLHCAIVFSPVFKNQHLGWFF